MLKTISVSWKQGTLFFNSGWQCWEGDKAKRVPNLDTQNMCSSYQDKPMEENCDDLKYNSIELGNIPNICLTCLTLNLILAGLCLSHILLKSSESSFTWTGEEAPTVQKKLVGRRNTVIQVSDSYDLSLKVTTQMALLVPECLHRCGTVDKYIKVWAGSTWESRGTEKKVRGIWKHLH